MHWALFTINRSSGYFRLTNVRKPARCNGAKSHSAVKRNSMVSCQKGPTRHAYAWQIGPFWQDTLELWYALFALIVKNTFCRNGAFLSISPYDTPSAWIYFHSVCRQSHITGR